MFRYYSLSFFSSFHLYISFNDVIIWHAVNTFPFSEPLRHSDILHVYILDVKKTNLNVFFSGECEPLHRHEINTQQWRSLYCRLILVQFSATFQKRKKKPEWREKCVAILRPVPRRGRAAYQRARADVGPARLAGAGSEVALTSVG